MRIRGSSVNCIFHDPVAEKTELSSLCWNMAQILDFKAVKRKTIIKTMFPQIPVQIISKSLQNTNVDPTEHPSLQNNPQSSENTPKHISKTFLFYCWQNILWLPLVLSKSFGNIQSSMVYSTIQKNGSSSQLSSVCTIACVLSFHLFFSGSLSD